MLGIICLDTADRLFAFVEMNTDKDAISRAIRDRGSILKRNITVTDSRHQRGKALGLQ